MTANEALVIAGAGLAGAKAAETLRAEGFDGPVVLIGDENERPYERPPLSKDYLMGKAERDSIYVHPADWYREHDVDLRLGAAVTGIDRERHEVTLADGSRVGYGKLLLATGSSPRRLHGAGAGLAGRALPAHGRRQRRDQAGVPGRGTRGGDRRGLDRARGGRRGPHRRRRGRHRGDGRAAAAAGARPRGGRGLRRPAPRQRRRPAHGRRRRRDHRHWRPRQRRAPVRRQPHPGRRRGGGGRHHAEHPARRGGRA